MLGGGQSVMQLVSPDVALVRPPSASFASCIREDRDREIDVALARQQHAGYVAALRDAGCEIVALDPLEGAPDAPFVEDTAVVLDSCALVTRPGARARRAEVASIAAALGHRRSLTVMTPPGTIDGGDVMRVGKRLVVGLSQRTDRDGVAALAKVAATDGIAVIAIAVPAGLHLKSACSVVRDDLVVVHGALAPHLGAALGPGIEVLAVPEPAGANVLGLRDRVIVSAAAPRTATLLADRGLDVRAVELSEFHAADGALTCLSLRWVTERPDTWVV